MTRTTLSYNGMEYAAIEIEAYKIDNEVKNTNLTYTICDIEFWWDALERLCMNGDKVANEIDNMIYYYCDSGFCASNPTEEQVINYFNNLNL